MCQPATIRTPGVRHGSVAGRGRARSVGVTLTRAVAAALLAAAAAAPAVADVVARGERLVRVHCGGCHAVGRADDSPLTDAPPLRAMFGAYPPAHLAEALAEGIVTGHPGMPEFRFAPAEIDAVVAYLEQLSRPAARRRPAE
ncbi:MAG: c-type cytochrome [Alphaproteobacteria bacterium]|jgi:mono/diheme cytochrome c family protein|nr:c-type cytochrome [Alphaproteobacteria bacterium]